MMWWRGNGHWLGLIVAVLVVLGAKLGHSGLIFGLLLSAVIIYFLRDDESSLYSVPVRFWPPLLGALALLIAIKG